MFKAMGKSFLEDLSALNLSTYLESGFVFMDRDKEFAWLGVLETASADDYDVFHSNFYNTAQFYFKSPSIFKIPMNTFAKFLSEREDGEFNYQLLETSDQSYMDDLARSIEKIRNSEKLHKLVCVTTAKFNSSGKHPLFAFKKLKELDGFIYGIWGDRIENVLGVSPEPLFIRSRDSYSTVALAGTISTKTEGYKSILMNDIKEREEHDLVIKDIENKLSKLGANTEIAETKVRDFGALAHLETEMKFKSNLSPVDVVKTLSPTAALGGYPTDIALEELKQMNYFSLDKNQRSFGGVYSFNLHDTEFALVGIRNIFWDGRLSTIHSGGGIVSASNPESELQEVKNKRSLVVELFK